jgi:ribosomal-protein-alanine N-acetyltransferase
MADNPCPLLETQNLKLVPVSADLASKVCAFYERIARHLAPWDPPSPPDFTTEAFQLEWLAKAAKAVATGTEARWWLQNPSAPAEVIGSVSLTQIVRGPFQNAMLGYAIDGAHQGRGLMREALVAVMEHAFSSALHLHRVQANVRPENTRSVALLRRLGFEQEGLARDYLFIDGAWRDHLMFARRNANFADIRM